MKYPRQNLRSATSFLLPTFMSSQKSLTYWCYAAMISLSIGINLLPVYLTHLSDLYGGAEGLSKESLGRLGGFAFSGLVLGILVTGPLADRWGAKLFAQAGNAMIVASLIACAFSPDYSTLCVSLFCLGLGAGVLDMILSPVVAAINPDNRAVAMNWLHSFYCVGAVVTIIMGTIALRLSFSWKFICLIFTFLPVIVFMGFAVQRFPDLHAHESQPIKLRTLLTHLWFWGALAGIFLGGSAELGLAQWLPAYAETTLKFPAWIGGTALLLFSVAMAMGRMVAGSMGKHWNPYKTMIWSCTITTLFFIGGSFSPHPWVALSFCVAAGFTGSALWPTMLAVTADRYPQGGTTMFGALATLGNAGGIFMPWLVGLVADHSNLRYGLAISCFASLAMIPLLSYLMRRQHDAY